MAASADKGKLAGASHCQMRHPDTALFPAQFPVLFVMCRFLGKVYKMDFRLLPRFEMWGKVRSFQHMVEKAVEIPPDWGIIALFAC